jgi:hypothetical protein
MKVRGSVQILYLSSLTLMIPNSIVYRRYRTTVPQVYRQALHRFPHYVRKTMDAGAEGFLGHSSKTLRI